MPGPGPRSSTAGRSSNGVGLPGKCGLRLLRPADDVGEFPRTAPEVIVEIVPGDVARQIEYHSDSPAGSSFKFYYSDWTEFIRDASASDYWTMKRKGGGDIRFVPSEAELGAGIYRVRVDVSTMCVSLTLVEAEPVYPERLFLFGPAAEAGWSPDNFIPFIVSNTAWLTEYGAAGSFDEGCLGWELVQGSGQFYPLLLGFASGSCRITADLSAGKVVLEKM